MAKFEDLSTEMVQSIVAQMNNDTLAATSRTSKYLHSLVEPVLYGLLSLEYSEMSRNDAIFLRSCLHRPALLSYIKKFEFHAVEDLQTSIELAHWDLSYQDRLGYRLDRGFSLDTDQWMAKIALTLERNFCSEFDDYFAPLWAGALIATWSPNLECLSLTNPNVKCRIPIPARFDQAVSDSTASKSMKTISDLNRRKILAEFIVFFYLMHVQSYPPVQILLEDFLEQKVYGRGSMIGHHLADTSVSGSMITTLILEKSALREAALEGLLKYTPSLKSLRYEFYCDTTPTTDTHANINSTYLFGDLLLMALLNVSETLENLTITTGFFSSSGVEVDSRSECGIKRNNTFDLSYFDKLASLEIPFELLLPYDSFQDPMPSINDHIPPNLRCVFLSDDLWFLNTYTWKPVRKAKMIENWLGEKGGPTKLTELKLKTTFSSGYVMEDFENRKVAEHLGYVCEQFGIEYTLVD